MFISLEFEILNEVWFGCILFQGTKLSNGNQTENALSRRSFQSKLQCNLEISSTNFFLQFTIKSEWQKKWLYRKLYVTGPILYLLNIYMA